MVANYPKEKTKKEYGLYPLFCIKFFKIGNAIIYNAQPNYKIQNKPRPFPY
jgi:hypothetical protein